MEKTWHFLHAFLYEDIVSIHSAYEESEIHAAAAWYAVQARYRLVNGLSHDLLPWKPPQNRDV